MKIEERPLLSSSVRERDIDLIIVQLVQTSPPFRRWFSNRFTADTDLRRFLGVSHSVGTIHGETDIEIGFETNRQNHHLILIENKITASFQDNQIERYFKRGETYVANGDCDGFSVGLVAPDGYVSESNRDAFDSVVTYEDTISQLDTLSHDGVPFFRNVLELAIKKRERQQRNKYPLFSDLNRRIMDRALPEIQHLVLGGTSQDPICELDTRGPWLKSQHEDHPESVIYRFKIQLQQEGKTISPGDVEVRLDTERGADPEDSLDLLEENAPQFEQNGFTFTGNSTFGIAYDYWEEVDPAQLESDEFLDEVARRFAELVELGHNILTSGE